MINGMKFPRVGSELPGANLALALAGLSAAFILGTVWYTVLTGSDGAAPRSPSNFVLTAEPR